MLHGFRNLLALMIRSTTSSGQGRLYPDQALLPGVQRVADGNYVAISGKTRMEVPRPASR